MRSPLAGSTLAPGQWLVDPRPAAQGLRCSHDPRATLGYEKQHCRLREINNLAATLCVPAKLLTFRVAPVVANMPNLPPLPSTPIFPNRLNSRLSFALHGFLTLTPGCSCQPSSPPIVSSISLLAPPCCRCPSLSKPSASSSVCLATA